jgi:hypothetical protein
MMRIKSTETSLDLYLAQRLQAADRMAKQFCKRNLETQNYLAFESGQEQTELAIAERPIQCPVFSGTLTNGSPVVTGLVSLLPYPIATNGTTLSGTQNLIVGMPAAVCASTGKNTTLAALPINTSILTVDSPTQVTLNNSAAQSGSFNLVFGIDVYLDLQGWAGDAAGSFAAPTQLMLGLNYIIRRNKRNTPAFSTSGLIQRISGGPLTAGWWGFGGIQSSLGSPVAALSATPVPRWTAGFENIKVAWTAGLGVGAAPPSAANPFGGTLPALTTLPFELADALCKMVTWDRLATPVGIPANQETWAKGTAAQINAITTDNPELTTARGILRSYREMSM